MHRTNIARTLFAALGIAALSTAALASEHEHEHGRASRAAMLPAYEQECASCHVAFPVQLLPANSWRRIMNSLNRHYGTDASLDASTAAEISAWLNKNAGTGRRVSDNPPEDRITRSAWFVRKHDEVPTAAWKRASIRSAANCAACHTTAAQGDYDEDNVRIPK